MTPAGLIMYALTGQTPDTDPGGTTPDAIRAGLGEAGWSLDEVRAHADDCRQRDVPWPHPLPAGAKLPSPAQWYAALTAVVSGLGLDAVPLPPSNRTALTDHERRLMADVPPHYGTAG